MPLRFLKKDGIVKNWLYCILAVLFLVAGCSTASGPAGGPLRYDGVYRSSVAHGGGASAYWYYLRFYPDGEVIAASSGDQPEELGKWFNKDYAGAGLGRGKVAIKGSRVSFSSTTTAGVVDYTGELRNGTLHFDTVSHINGHHDGDDFVFIRLGAP
jgi:hypothetical protein